MHTLRRLTYTKRESQAGEKSLFVAIVVIGHDACSFVVFLVVDTIAVKKSK